MKLSHLAWLTGVSAIVATLLSVYLTHRVASAELEEILMEDLLKQSRVLAMSISSSQLSEQFDQMLTAVFAVDEEDTLWVTVYDIQSGQQVSNIDHTLPLDQEGSGTITRRFAGFPWSGYQFQYEGLVTQVLRRGDYGEDIRSDIAEDIAIPGLLASAVTLFLLFMLVNAAVRPLSGLSHELQARGAADLSPVRTDSRVQEIGTVTDHLNRLLQELSEVLVRERQFTSDVAHELRTPLTTLNLELSLPDPDTELLKQETGRLMRVVEQLLTMARLEQMQWKKRFEAVSMSTLIADEMTRFQPRYAQRNMVLLVDSDDQPVTGDPTLLQVMIDNLLHNCLRHCPDATLVQLSWRDQVLSVTDNGPGIPPAIRQTMTQRFASFDQKGENLGLGLSIAQKIAEVHGATLALDDAEPGLQVRVVFNS